MGNQRDEKTELLNRSLEEAKAALDEKDIVSFVCFVMVDAGEQRIFSIDAGERVRILHMIFGDSNLVGNLLLAAAHEDKQMAELIVRVAIEVVVGGVL